MSFTNSVFLSLSLSYLSKRYHDSHWLLAYSVAFKTLCPCVQNFKPLLFFVFTYRKKKKKRKKKHSPGPTSFLITMSKRLSSRSTLKYSVSLAVCLLLFLGEAAAFQLWDAPNVNRYMYVGMAIKEEICYGMNARTDKWHGIAFGNKTKSNNT